MEAERESPCKAIGYAKGEALEPFSKEVFIICGVVWYDHVTRPIMVVRLNSCMTQKLSLTHISLYNQHISNTQVIITWQAQI